MTKRADFLRANKGKRRVTPGFILQISRRDDADGARLGITVTKKIGNAVVRNRMKRRFRALAREILSPVARPDTDYVLIGRDGGVERDFALLKADLASTLTPVA